MAWMRGDDAATEVLDLAAAILRGDSDEVARLEALIDGLDHEAVVRFDLRARGTLSWLSPDRIATLPPGAVLGLVSADGRRRETAVRRVELRPGTVALLAVRATDWVDEVREAALRRLAGVPVALLLEMLPLADGLALRRSRGAGLAALLDARLGDDDLQVASRFHDARTRRVAWRRLIERGAYDAAALRTALADPDVLVRTAAARAISPLAAPDRRAAAQHLLGDRVGRLAALGLAALVELDGTAPILGALVARNASLRRHARGWAAVRGIDARAVYLERLADDPRDAAALVALAEIADPRDAARVQAMLGDPRSGVRAAALRALPSFDPVAGKAAALDELTSDGPAAAVAAAVLRRSRLQAGDLRRLESLALDPARPLGRRLRALALLRPARWLHLATVMRMYAATPAPERAALHLELRDWVFSSSALTRGPDDRERKAITEHLSAVDPDLARSIEFVLRTAH